LELYNGWYTEMIYTFIMGSMLFPFENATAINHSINTGQYNTGVPPKEPLMDVAILACDVTTCQKADVTIFEGSSRHYSWAVSLT